MYQLSIKAISQGNLTRILGWYSIKNGMGVISCKDICYSFVLSRNLFRLSMRKEAV